jgi:hypothetical protein
MLIYHEDLSISKLKKERAEWDLIEREGILERFMTN